MRRRPFPVLSALSLLLCVAMSLLWARSYWDEDHVTWTGRTGRFSISNCLNRIDFLLFRGGDYSSEQQGLSFHGREKPTNLVVALGTLDAIFFQFPTNSKVRKLGPLWGFSFFGFRDPADEGWWDVAFLSVPYWAIVVTSAILPVRWLALRLQQHARLDRGTCHSCGYDLTGNLSGTCPECGTAVNRQAGGVWN